MRVRVCMCMCVFARAGVHIAGALQSSASSPRMCRPAFFSAVADDRTPPVRLSRFVLYKEKNMLLTQVVLSRRSKVPIPAGDRRQKVRPVYRVLHILASPPAPLG